MQSDEKNAKPTENTPFTPTILQTMYSLDSNTIKDKETIVKIINSMKANEKAVEGDIKEATTYVSIFETTAKPEEENENETRVIERFRQIVPSTFEVFLAPTLSTTNIFNVRYIVI